MAWIRDTRNQIDNGITFKGVDIKLKVFLADWLKTVSSSKSKGTHITYSWTVRKRILPYIGNINIMDIKPDRIQRFYHRLQNEGASNHAVCATHKTLRVALNHAIKLKLIDRHPCSGTTPPKPEQTEMKFYDTHQVKHFLQTAKEIGDRFYPLYFLAIHTGMRAF